MKSKPLVVACIPALNEEKSIAKVVLLALDFRQLIQIVEQYIQRVEGARD